MKELLLVVLAAVVLDFGLIFGIDAEVARRDREFGRKPEGCLFASNCWQSAKNDDTLAEKNFASLKRK